MSRRALSRLFSQREDDVWFGVVLMVAIIGLLISMVALMVNLFVQEPPPTEAVQLPAEGTPAAYLARIDSLLQLARSEKQQLDDRTIDELLSEKRSRQEIEPLIVRSVELDAYIQRLESARQQVEALDARFRREIQPGVADIYRSVQRFSASVDSLLDKR